MERLNSHCYIFLITLIGMYIQHGLHIFMAARESHWFLGCSLGIRWSTSLILSLLSSVGIHCRFSDLGSFLEKVPRRAGNFPVLHIKTQTFQIKAQSSQNFCCQIPNTGVSSCLGQFISGSPLSKQLSYERKLFYFPRYSWFLFQSIYGF